MTLALLRRRLADGFHVSPFLVLGDPTPETSVAIARATVEAGATLLELGFPYGAACADGPAIQAAHARALDGGTSTSRAFDLLRSVRDGCPEVALNLLVYGNLVHRRGLERFCRDAVAAGASSLLVPDMPLEEGDGIRAGCAAAGLGHVELVGPYTGDERLRRLDASADAFLYLAAYQGVTGGGGRVVDAWDRVRQVAAAVRNPVCAGFGISTAEQVARARDAGARLAVVGSALAELIARTPTTSAPQAVERAVRALVPQTAATI